MSGIPPLLRAWNARSQTRNLLSGLPNWPPCIECHVSCRILMSDIPTRLESRCQAWNLMSNLHTDVYAMSAIYTLNYEVVMASGTSCKSIFPM